MALSRENPLKPEKKVVDPPIFTKDDQVVPENDWPTYKYRDIEKRRAQVREAVRRYRERKNGKALSTDSGDIQ